MMIFIIKKLNLIYEPVTAIFFSGQPKMLFAAQ